MAGRLVEEVELPESGRDRGRGSRRLGVNAHQTEEPKTRTWPLPSLWGFLTNLVVGQPAYFDMSCTPRSITQDSRTSLSEELPAFTADWGSEPTPGLPD